MDSRRCTRTLARVYASSRRWSFAALALVAIAAAVPVATSGSSANASASNGTWPPPTLRDTGLYSDWASKTVARENLPFSPQYPLWSDGATKSRWLHIPKGRFISASNPDVWNFPVGTRLWKEFRFERRVETRFIEYTRAGWQFASYQWNEDESDAPLAPETGVLQSAPIREGVRHAIPSRIDCRACHEAGPVRVLGVTALQLSPDRDPNAPHAEAKPAGGVDLADLMKRGLVRGLPPAFATTPPRIDAPSPTARAALGYLHANCGGCHTGAGELKSLAFALNYTLARPAGEPAPILLTAVGQPSKFKIPGEPETIERVCAGKPDRSVLIARMSSRHPLVQMPPLGTRIVDEDAVTLVKQWIAEDLAPREPAIATREER
jgi:hypothetical protein